jgi:hypothetical protein
MDTRKSIREKKKRREIAHLQLEDEDRKLALHRRIEGVPPTREDNGREVAHASKINWSLDILATEDNKTKRWISVRKIACTS